MIEVAAGILLAFLILLFLGSILRAAMWLAIGAALILALFLMLIISAKFTLYFLLAIILVAVALLILSRATPSRPIEHASLHVVRDTPRIGTAAPTWLGDGRRIVTAAFGPFQIGDVIDHWQVDYVRVFIGEREFSAVEVAEKSRPL